MDSSSAHPTKLLFVCSRNRIRSLTAERIFDGLPGIQVRSVGTQPDARSRVTEGHIGWADIIFVMEKSHLERLQHKFPEAMLGKRVVTLLVPDDYEFMEQGLVDDLHAKVARHISLPESGREA